MMLQPVWHKKQQKMLANMRIVDIHEAKTHFSKLVNSVLHGDEILIAMAGKPVAKLCPY